jgi:hypothetical protein
VAEKKIRNPESSSEIPNQKIGRRARAFCWVYGLLVICSTMLTRSDVESAAGSRSCVSGVSGKAFTIVLEVRTGSPQTKTPYDSTAKDEGRINFT